MKTFNKIALLLLVAGMILVTGCNKNYYSGSGKGGNNCGCPSHKGMTGY
jgi:predicted small secreted protein